MTTIDELYQMFGPLLLDGIMKTLLAEINELRGKLTLPAITEQTLVNQISETTKKIDHYPWMVTDDLNNPK